MATTAMMVKSKSENASVETKDDTDLEIVLTKREKRWAVVQ